MSYTTPPAPPPPPPPPPGGYGSYGAPGYGAAPTGQLASWPIRLGGYLIDYLLFLPGIILYSVGLPKNTVTTVNGVSSMAMSGGNGVLVAVGFLWILVVAILNRWIRGGAGASLGKRVVGLRLLGETTGQPIGALQAFLRDLAHIADSIICGVGWLFPLWDAKRQTLADKIVKTVVVKA